MPINKEHQLNLGYVVAAIGLLVLYQLWLGSQQYLTISYSDFTRYAADGNIAVGTVVVQCILSRSTLSFSRSHSTSVSGVNPSRHTR